MSLSTNEKKPSCWATLLTRTSYLAGALVMNQSLIKHKSAYPLVVFATIGLPKEARDILESQGIRVRDIDYLEPETKLELDGHDERFADTWTKLRCFEMVEYERVVMVDSDMLVMKNMDELMTMDLPSDWVAAVHACTCNPRKLAHYPKNWIPENCAHTQAKLTQPLLPAQFTLPTHHCINSGLVVLTPSLEIFKKITTILNNDPIVQTFKFPDQDLLAYAFMNKFLPIGYQYNALKTLRDCHVPMWRDEDCKNLHYILDKPWAGPLKEGEPNYETHSWWWNAYFELEKSWGTTPGWEIVEGCVKRTRST